MTLQEFKTAKISISGGSGTGKTTLARALAQELSLPFLAEDFTELTKAGLRYNRIDAATEAESLQLRQRAFQEFTKACLDWLKNRQQLYSAHPGYVADRSGFDILMQWTITRVPFDIDATLRQILALCQKESGRHDLIVIPPLTKWSLHPGNNESGLVRKTSLADKLHSHSTLIGLIQQFSTGPYLLLRPHPQQHDTTDYRIHEILSALKQTAAITASRGR